MLQDVRFPARWSSCCGRAISAYQSQAGRKIKTKITLLNIIIKGKLREDFVVVKPENRYLKGES